jgi:outer membrane biosynthesis protein TonB
MTNKVDFVDKEAGNAGTGREPNPDIKTEEAEYSTEEVKKADKTKTDKAKEAEKKANKVEKEKTKKKAKAKKAKKVEKERKAKKAKKIVQGNRKFSSSKIMDSIKNNNKDDGLFLPCSRNILVSNSDSDSNNNSASGSNSNSDSDSNSIFDSGSKSDSTVYFDNKYGKTLFSFPGTNPIKDVETIG